MKASLKLQLSEKPNKYGFPVYKILRAPGRRPVKKTVLRTFANCWNTESNEITKAHPGYDFYITEILNIKSAIAAINANRYDYDQAKTLLFGDDLPRYGSFYISGLRFDDGSTNGKLYRTVLNSFNRAFPGVGVEHIKPSDVQLYMKTLLKKQKPNGVHTYLRTLSAIFKLVAPDLPNPFSGVRPSLVETPDKDLTVADLQKVFFTRTYKKRYDGHNNSFTVNRYRYYYMLLFLLGGIDFVDLYNLRYDKHIVGNRLQFTRFKGGTNAFINNVILPEAWQILDQFKCYPYLVPLYKYKRVNDALSNMNNRFCNQIEDLDLTRRPLTKTARYTFINIAQDLLIDERIVGQIIGHKIRRTTGIYAREFPLKVVDDVHVRILKEVLL